MKSSTENFESSMCRVVRVSKRQARGLGDKCCCFQEDPSLPASPSSAPRSPGHGGGGAAWERDEEKRHREGPPDTERDHRTQTFRNRETQRETVRSRPRKGKKEKREVKRLNGCEERVRKLGKMFDPATCQCNQQTPLLSFSLC